MTRRYTETEKWKDLWFRELKPLEKLLFTYLCDNCDIAGVWEIDITEAAYKIGANIELVEQALSTLERCYFRNERFLILKNFLFHQKNLPLNPNNKCHSGILARLGQHRDLWERLNQYWKERDWVVLDRNLFNQESALGRVKRMRGQ